MDNNNSIDKSNIINKTFENQNYKNILQEKDNLFNSPIINNNDIKAQTLSLFGLNKNNILDLNDNSINNTMIIKQPQFELENIYRERLLSLYKDKDKEELLNYFIESEINNILLRKEIEKNKLNKIKLENKIIDIEQENMILKNKIKNYLINHNDDDKYNKYNINQIDENNLSLPNRSFVQKELNIHNEYNNMDIDALLINNK